METSMATIVWLERLLFIDWQPESGWTFGVRITWLDLWCPDSGWTFGVLTVSEHLVFGRFVACLLLVGRLVF